MAYIRKTAQTCPICGKKAEHEVFNIRNASMGIFCNTHAKVQYNKLKIREYSATLEEFMTVLRSFLYCCARILGDIQAIRRGRVGMRIARRAAGRITGRALGRLFR